MDKQHYKVKEFNRARLSRGEQHCYKAEYFIDKKSCGLIWLSKEDIKNIKNDVRCSMELMIKVDDIKA